VCPPYLSLKDKECGCEQGYYLDSSQCSECPSLCTDCLSSEECLECVENASINQNSVCVCDPGFAQNSSECQESYFHASLHVTSINNLYLNFTSPLNKTLDKEDIQVTVDAKFSYEIEKKSPKEYLVYMNYQEVVEKNQVVKLDFQAPYIYSNSSQLLFEQSLQKELYEYDPYRAQEKRGEEAGQDLFALASSIGALSSISAPSPTIWPVANTLQIICYIPLTNLPITPRLKGFFKSQSLFRMLPNSVNYVSETKDSNTHKRSREFGYSSGQFLVNAGKPLSVLLAILVCWPFIWLMSSCKVAFISKKCCKLLDKYKLGVFIRYLVQSFLDLQVAALVQAYNFPESEVMSIVSFVLGTAFLVFLSGVPVALHILTTKKFKTDGEEQARFQRTFGNFYSEFNVSRNSSNKYFYFVYLVQRLLFAVSLVVLSNYPTAQATVNLAVLVGFLFFVTRYIPYKDPFVHVSNTLSQLGVLLLFTVLSYLQFTEIELGSKTETFLVYTTFFVLGTHSLGSFLSFLKGLSDIIKKRTKTKVRPQVSLNEIVNPSQDTSAFFKRETKSAIR